MQQGYLVRKTNYWILLKFNSGDRSGIGVGTGLGLSPELSPTPSDSRLQDTVPIAFGQCPD